MDGMGQSQWLMLVMVVVRNRRNDSRADLINETKSQERFEHDAIDSLSKWSLLPSRLESEHVPDKRRNLQRRPDFDPKQELGDLNGCQRKKQRKKGRVACCESLFRRQEGFSVWRGFQCGWGLSYSSSHDKALTGIGQQGTLGNHNDC